MNEIEYEALTKQELIKLNQDQARTINRLKIAVADGRKDLETVLRTIRMVKKNESAVLCNDALDSDLNEGKLT